jgi:hypothetical protein
MNPVVMPWMMPETHGCRDLLDANRLAESQGFTPQTGLQVASAAGPGMRVFFYACPHPAPHPPHPPDCTRQQY